MAFVFLPPSLSAGSYRRVQLGGSYHVAVLVGIDGAKEYSVITGLEPTAGCGFEYYFHLLEIDRGSGAEHTYWSGLPVSEFISEEDRVQILDVVLGATAMLLNDVSPQELFHCTHDENMPEGALDKHYRINELFGTLRYSVTDAGTRLGKRSWWVERPA